MKSPKEILEEFATWSRQKYGHQSKVAVILGVKPQVVHEWTAGRTRPNWEVGRNIEEFLEKI